MRLLYGTGNPAKFEVMWEMVAGLPIELVSPRQIGLNLPEVDESGRDPLQNACLKARAYYRAAGMPVFSCDSGLFLEGLPEALQPGVHVRRVGERSLTDEEMTAYYSALARQYGGRITAQYRNAICVVMDDEHIYAHQGEELCGERFDLVQQPHPNRRPGFPLDCLSVERSSGRYYDDLPGGVTHAMNPGFASFFRRSLAAYAADTARDV